MKGKAQESSFAAATDFRNRNKWDWFERIGRQVKNANLATLQHDKQAICVPGRVRYKNGRRQSGNNSFK